MAQFVRNVLEGNMVMTRNWRNYNKYLMPTNGYINRLTI